MIGMKLTIVVIILKLETLLGAPIELSPGQICSIAPAEGNIPLGIFQDRNAEELSFPTLFCGLPRQEGFMDLPLLQSGLQEGTAP